VLLFVLLVVAAAIVSHFAWLCPASGHSHNHYTWSYLLISYIQRWKVWKAHQSMMKELEKKCIHFSSEQERLLRDIISKNKNTILGQDLNLKTIQCRHDLKNHLSIADYAKYKSYTERMLAGESDVITPGKPQYIVKTSGTTGQSSHYSVTKECITPMVTTMGMWASLKQKHFSGMMHLGRKMTLMFSAKFGKSSGGTLIGPISLGMAIYHPECLQELAQNSTSPPEIRQIQTEQETLYIHLLFGLLDKDLISIECTYISVIYSAMMVLESRWRHLVKDIRNGSISEKLDIPEPVRDQLNKRLFPNPDRALEIETECSKGFERIIQRLWPRCSHILAVDTGTMVTFKDYLSPRHCKNIPIYSAMYNASEGLIASNIWPTQNKREYLLEPGGSVVYEFLPIYDEDMGEDAETVFGDEVQVGFTYEIIVTTYSGLYRHRLGDVVRVTRMYHNTPVIEYLYRRGEVLSICTEKVTEVSIKAAISKSLGVLGRDDLVEYTCTLSTVVDVRGENNNKVVPPYYVIFLAFQRSAAAICQRKLSTEMDNALQLIQPSYRTARQRSLIPSPIQVQIVDKEAFTKLKDAIFVQNGTSSNQFKLPRYLKKAEHVNILLNNRV
ncbi:unnamed protein product, partial [Owenia fusiformis]